MTPIPPDTAGTPETTRRPGPPVQDTIEAPFDQYQRYAITTAIARAMGGSAPPRVLDVGGHHLDFWFRPRRPIAEFLPEAPSITVDLARSRLPGYLCARGDALPFPDGLFDLVCSVDVMEHVPPAARATVLGQVRRASRRAAVVAAPFRTGVVERAETIVSDFIREACGYEQGQLQEHREHGWPDLDGTAAAFETAGWHVRVFGYGSLWTWVLMMVDKHALQAIAGSKRVQIALDRAFNETRFAADREAPHYRQFVVATRASDDPVLRFVEAHYDAVPPAAFRARPALDPAHVTSMFALLDTHAVNQRIQVRLEPERQHRQLADVEAHRTGVIAALEAMTSEAARLEGLLRQVERSPAFRVARWMRRLTGRS